MCAEASRFYDGHDITNGGVRFTVRTFTETYADRLVAFDRGLSDESRRRFAPHAYDRETVAEYARRSEAGVDVSYVLLDETERVVAYFFLWEAQLDVPLLGIGITDELQNRGLGMQLMEILIDTGKRMNRRGIDLTTMLDNDRAFHLYQKCGFEYLGDVPNLTGDGRIVTERRLFLPIVPGATAPDRNFGPPDTVAH